MPDRAGRSFFAIPASELAVTLVGCSLVRVLNDGSRLSGVIVETEAYIGPEDQASHAKGGRRTARNEPMWATPGTSYVYFTYGMHFCMNISANRADHPGAVLIRAIEPREGLQRMRELRSGSRQRRVGAKPMRNVDLCRGPARLCQALAIDRALTSVLGEAFCDEFIQLK
ncbi:MAG: DNA-3-methyladenine glycosylase, partial [Phycisphaerales bacterium]|nr:DNA-3-methyladenine glycosylase [Phycisphaerales bacterium]